MKYLLFSLLSLSPAILLARTWDKRISAPEIMGRDYTREFSALPMVGRVKSKSKFWSGYYWPNREGNINNRWNAKTFSKVPMQLSKTAASKLSIPELASLSPSEKMDLLNGNYHYPLYYEVMSHSDPRAQSWEGICHGWAAATLNHNEPEPKFLVNPDGIEVPFGSSDIKALLSYYYAYEFRVHNTHQMGLRCEESKRFSTFECTDDLNPGAFHTVLGNRVGLEKESLNADTNRGTQVSNHPVWGYDSKIISESGPQNMSAQGTYRVLKMKTVVTFVGGNSVDWRPILGSKDQTYVNENYEYYLELDRQNNIIGGEWISENRPDFLWRMEKSQYFEGHFTLLSSLLSNE